MADEKKMYAARMSEFGTPSLGEVHVKETASQYRLVGPENMILGSQTHRNVVRRGGDDVRLFADIRSAVQYLADEGNALIAKHEEKLAKLRATVESLKGVMAKQ